MIFPMMSLVYDASTHLDRQAAQLNVLCLHGTCWPSGVHTVQGMMAVVDPAIFPQVWLDKSS